MKADSLQTAQNGEDAAQNPGKMFIGGLNWQTTVDGLQNYFGRFGEISECMVMKDPVTKRSRGFGFITFSSPSSVDKVLAAGLHQLDAKVIDPKVAFPKKPNMSMQPKMITKTKKLFVGGLAASTTIDDIRSYFDQFGKIEDAMLMFDKVTLRHRGFAFVTFESEDIVNKVCEIHFHEINNKMVECKKAQPKELMIPQGVNRGYMTAGYPAAYASAYGPGYSLPSYYLSGYGIPVAQAAQMGSRSGQSPQGVRGGAPGRSYLSFSPQVVASGGVLSLVNNYVSSYGGGGSTCSQGGGRMFASGSSPGMMDIYSTSPCDGGTVGYMQTAGNGHPLGYPSIAGTLIPANFQNGFH